LEVIHQKNATALKKNRLNKDHLGNIRLSYSDADLNGSIDPNTEIIEENNYYPFGLKHKGYNNVVSANSNSVASKFGFGGKELQDELGLDWYDVSARNYDANLGRWMNVDPLAEQMRRHSPYNYAFNNPISFIDPDGMAPNDIIILSANKSVKGLGHAAVLIGDDKSGWRLYSKNGTNDNMGAFGESNKHPESGVYFENLNDFAKSSSNVDEEGNPLYTSAFRIETDKETDIKMEKAAAESVSSDYNVVTNSCIDVCSAALEAGGLPNGSETKTSATSNPMNPPSKTEFKSPIPNIRYNKITEQNKENGKFVTEDIKAKEEIMQN
jgi:RHS repeat-associated protein